MIYAGFAGEKEIKKTQPNWKGEVGVISAIKFYADRLRDEYTEEKIRKEDTDAFYEGVASPVDNASAQEKLRKDLRAYKGLKYLPLPWVWRVSSFSELKDSAYLVWLTDNRISLKPILIELGRKYSQDFILHSKDGHNFKQICCTPHDYMLDRFGNKFTYGKVVGQAVGRIKVDENGEPLITQDFLTMT